MIALTGTGKLVRLILRRDRIVLPVWIVLIGILPVVYASGVQQVYPTEAGRQQFYASIAANPSFTSMFGPVFGPSLGALTAWRAGAVTGDGYWLLSGSCTPAKPRRISPGLWAARSRSGPRWTAAATAH